MTEVVFFIAAHPDDALLFRGDTLYDDAHHPDLQVVHITTSAGDAGRTDGWWQTRERALLTALDATQTPAPRHTTQQSVNGHRITRHDRPGCSSWVLRLPDGGLDGNGFPATDRRTLARLQAGSIGSLAAVDGSTTYTSWADLQVTVRAICSRERDAAETPQPWINTSDPDPGANPGDHPDHYATAAAVASFAAADGYHRAWWVSYDVRDRPANLAGFRLDAKRFLFQAYGWASGGPNDTEWQWWGPKRYERIEP